MSRRRETVSSEERSARVLFGRGVVVVVAEVERVVERVDIASGAIIGLGVGARNAADDVAARATSRAESL